MLQGSIALAQTVVGGGGHDSPPLQRWPSDAEHCKELDSPCCTILQGLLYFLLMKN